MSAGSSDQNGQTRTRLHLISGAWTAEVDPNGAELVRLTYIGRDLLWNGDPQIWSGHAPILFPIVGMLAGGHYRLDGTIYPMHKHGFARTSLFTVTDHTPDSLTFRLVDNHRTRAVYPFSFCLDLTFALTSPGLTVTAQVTNNSTHTMPMSFGFHPAFRWPLPFGAARADHRIVFVEDEPAPIRRMNANGLLETVPQATPVEGKTLRLRDDLFVDDAIIFDALRSRALCYGAPGTPAIALAFSGLPDLGIWTKPGADFICLEPWQGYNDPEAFDGDIWDKPGIVGIDPAATRQFSMTISVEDNAR